MRIILSAFFILIMSLHVSAQQNETFSNYMKGLPTASVPLSGSEPMIVMQSGLAKQTAVNSVGAVATGVDIRTLGADGTAANDDTAFKAAFALTSPANILIPNGTWNLPCSAHYSAASGVRLVGQNQFSTVIKFPSGCSFNSGNSLFFWQSVSGGGVQNLTIDLNTPLTPTATYSVIQANSQLAVIDGFSVINVSLLNMVAANSGSVTVGGISPLSVAGLTFSNLVIQNNYIQFKAAYTAQALCVAMTTVNNSGFITGAQIVNNTCVGGDIQIDGNNALVSGNDVSGFGFGSGLFFPASGSHHQIVNNRIHDTTAGRDINNTPHLGIEIHSPYSTVQGNTLFKLGGPGITADADYTTYSDNLIFDNGKQGGVGTQSGIFVEVVESTGTGVLIGSGNNIFDDGAGTQVYAIEFGGSIPSSASIRLSAGSKYSGVTGAFLFNSAMGAIQSDWLFTQTIACTTGVGCASASFTGLDTASYKEWNLACREVTPFSASQKVLVQVGEGSTPSWNTSANYAVKMNQTSGAGVTFISTATSFGLIGGGSWDNTNGNPGSFSMTFGDLSFAPGTAFKHAFYIGQFFDTTLSDDNAFNGQGWWNGDTNAITAIRVISSSGNLYFSCTLMGRPAQ